MSLTFLQLASRWRQEVGGSGTGPSTVVSQVGEYARGVSWIATADEDIQRARNEWLFMRRGFTVQTVADTAAYAYGSCTDTTTSAVITNFREWDKEKFKIYLTSGGVAGERSMTYMDYQTWYEIYNTHTQTSSFPVEFTVLANRSFSLGPKPNAVYTVSGEYQMSVTTMTANADVPLYPAEYHLLPMWKAMVAHGYYTGAPELIQRGNAEAAKLMYQMERTQLPELLLEESRV